VLELQAFLELQNFYSCFVPAAAIILQLLGDVLGSSFSGKAMMKWSTAFDKVKNSLEDHAAMVAIIFCDTLRYTLGA
jgi:hypothetical protein